MSGRQLYLDKLFTAKADAAIPLVSVGSLLRVVDVPGWYPDDDSDSIHSGADLKTANDAFLELRAAYAERVRTVRKHLRLMQEEAGRIIGVGRWAFQKYESGVVPPSDAAVGLLEILDRHPEEVETLRQLRMLAPGLSRAPGADDRKGRRGRRELARA